MSKFLNIVSNKKNKKKPKNTFIQQKFIEDGNIPNPETETYVYNTYVNNNGTNVNNDLKQQYMSIAQNLPKIDEHYNQNVNFTENLLGDESSSVDSIEVLSDENIGETEELLLDEFSDSSISENISSEINDFVNPVYSDDTLILSNKEEIKVGFFSVIKLIIGMIIMPGVTITVNPKKYNVASKSLMVSLWITGISILLCVVSRILFGSFVKSYNSVTGFGRIYFDFTNIFNINNYLEYLLLTFLCSFGVIFVLSLIYYASSFINSKGVYLGTYIMVSNLAVIPLIIGVVILYPALSLINEYLGMMGLIFTFLYSLISFFVGINEILIFKNLNNKIIYNTINLSLVLVLFISLLFFLIRVNVISIIGINF